MQKYIDILHSVLSGTYSTDKYDIQSNGHIDFAIKLIDNKIHIIFGDNKPSVISKFIIRIKLPINAIVFDGEYMYVKPDGWSTIPINIKDLSSL